MNRKLKIGIAGFGVVGQRRKIYIDQNLHMETVCVSDTTFPDSGKFQDGVEYFTEYKHLFQRKLDVLFVSLPNYLAAEATIEGLEHGCNGFLEKPTAKTEEELEKVIEVEEK